PEPRSMTKSSAVTAAISSSSSVISGEVGTQTTSLPSWPISGSYSPGAGSTTAVCCGGGERACSTTIAETDAKTVGSRIAYQCRLGICAPPDQYVHAPAFGLMT